MALGLRRLPLLLAAWLLGLRAGVVVGELDADLARILALAVEGVPAVRLSAAGVDDVVEGDEGVADQLRLAVVVEDRDLDAVVVGRVVDGEAQLLVPACVSTPRCSMCWV